MDVDGAFDILGQGAAGQAGRQDRSWLLVQGRSRAP
jgi:hypothetical protein